MTYIKEFQNEDVNVINQFRIYEKKMDTFRHCNPTSDLHYYIFLNLKHFYIVQLY